MAFAKQHSSKRVPPRRFRMPGGFECPPISIGCRPAKNEGVHGIGIGMGSQNDGKFVVVN